MYELYQVPKIEAPTRMEDVPAHIKRMELELHRWNYAGEGTWVGCHRYEEFYSKSLYQMLHRLGFKTAREVSTSYGRIDVMAWLDIEGKDVAKHIFELKVVRHNHNIYQAIGQLLSYQCAYPDAALWLLAQESGIKAHLRMVLKAHDIRFLRRSSEGWREGLVRKNITASPFILSVE